MSIINKNLLKICFFLTLYSPWAFASIEKKIFGPVLQTSSNTLLISAFVMSEIKRHSLLTFYNSETRTSKPISLPIKLENRAVVALARHKDSEKYFVVTQWQRGDIDNPQLHLWNSRLNTWEDLGSLNCKSFHKYEILKGELRLKCKSETEIDKKGNLKEEAKSFLNTNINTEYKGTSFIQKIEQIGHTETQLRITFKDKRAPLTLEANSLF